MKPASSKLLSRLILIGAVVAVASLFRSAPSEHRLVLALGAERAHLRSVQLDCYDEQRHRSGSRWWFDAANPPPSRLALNVQAVGSRSRCEIQLRAESGAVATEHRTLQLDADQLTLRLESSVQQLAAPQRPAPMPDY